MDVDKIQVMHFNCGTVVVTENDVGVPYVINCEYFYDLYKDWDGECNLCPANDAPVYFAMYADEPVNPYKYKDFESFMKYMIVRTGLDR